MNLYGYASGDPVNFSDPFGLNPCIPFPKPECLQAVADVVNTAALKIAGAVASVMSVFTPGPDELALGAALPVLKSAAGKISSRVVRKFGGSVDEWVGKAMSSGTRYVDTEHGGNISYFLRRPDGKGYIRVTLDPDEERVISGGLNKLRDLEKWTASGRLVK